MADNRWFLAVQGNRIGPLPDDQLPDLIKEGKLEPETLVWRKGLGAWKPAKEVEEIQPLLAAGTPAAAEPAAASPAPESTPAGGAAWFVAEGGTKLGPLPAEKLVALAREGRLDGETFVWRKGQGDWKPAKDVPEMAPFLAARPAATPEPAPAPEGKPEPAPAAQPKPAPTPPQDRWYIARGGDRIGPFVPSDFPTLVADGKLAPDSLVWRKGQGAWKPAREIPEMEAALASPPAATDTAWEAESDGPEVASDAEVSEAKAVSDPVVEDILRRMTDSADKSATPAGAEPAPAAEEPSEEPAPAVEEPSAEPAPAAEEPSAEPVMEGAAGEDGTEPAPVDDTAETTTDLAADTGAPADAAPEEAAPAAEGTSGPVPVEQVLEQRAAADVEPEGEWAAIPPEAVVAASKKPVAALPAAEKPAAPKPRKKASIPLLVLLSVAALVACVPLLYEAFVQIVKGSQPNPFAPALPPWGAELSAWAAFLFLPFLGVLSALVAPFRVRWAHAGQLWFWLLLGAGLGTIWGVNLESLAAAMQSFFKQAQADFARVPWLAGAAQWCEQQSVTRTDVSFPTITAIAGVAVALIGVVYLLWRFPWTTWEPATKPAAPPARKGAPEPPAPEPPPKEGFSLGRWISQIAFLSWVFLFLPFWLINELIVLLKWSDTLALPLGRTFGMQMSAAKLDTYLHVLPVLALMGMGMVLLRWRPYRGTVKTARLLGLLSLLLFLMTAWVLPANHLLQRKPKPKPAAAPETAPDEATPDAPAPKPGAGAAADPMAGQAEAARAADAKLKQATDLLQELQPAVKSGTTGLKPKADRIDGLIGEAVASYDKIQEAYDKAHVNIPGSLLESMKRATEAKKVLRLLRAEMK